MEKWEHSVLRAEFNRAEQNLQLIEASGRRETLDQERARPETIVAALGDLGEQGWQLVSVETQVWGAQELRLYWLKRRLDV